MEIEEEEGYRGQEQFNELQATADTPINTVAYIHTKCRLDIPFMSIMDIRGIHSDTHTDTPPR